ncbi:MAG TPA: TlpA disulfide reductase family protein [bacterium]|nr:TlpA disulfide reductase family protein [bacterium]
MLIARLKRLLVISLAIAALAGCSGEKKQAEANGIIPMDKVVFFDVDGKQKSLEELSEGKPLYLAFFASWCKSCSHEVPQNNSIYRKYISQGLAVYGVNIGDSKEIINGFVKKYGIEYPVVRDPDGRTAGQYFNLLALPLIVVIDAEGNEIYHGSVPPPNDVIESILGE